MPERVGAFAGVDAARASAMSRLPASVPSAPQTGQKTGPGSFPLWGSTSNLNLDPHGQRTLISIVAISVPGQFGGE